MAELEAGVFVVLLMLGFFFIFMIKKDISFMLLAALVFGAIATFMLAGYDVVTTTQKPEYNVTSTTVQTLYNSTSGGEIANSTKSQTVFVPPSEDKVKIIDSTQVVIGYLFMAIAIILLILWIAIMLGA